MGVFGGPARAATVLRSENEMTGVRIERNRQARELRDACMLLAARHGLAVQWDGTHLTEVVLDPFLIWLISSGRRRDVEVWHAGTRTAKVLSLRWAMISRW